nr:hypothetical protein [Anaerolineae bacterium]
MSKFTRFSLTLMVLLFASFGLHAQDLTPQERAVEAIQVAIDSNRTYLNLGQLGLTEIPAEITQATSVE